MGFLKNLFGIGKDENDEEKSQAEEARNFDILKYDGVKALKSHQYEYAVRCLSHALDMRDDLETTDYLSQAYVMTGQLTLAYDMLQKLAEAQPDNQQIFIRMANIAYMLEDYHAMTSACEKALIIDNGNPVVNYLYAQACLGEHDTSNAVALLTKALSLDKNFGDALLLRGETLLADGNITDADADADALLQQVPDNEDALLLKARIEKSKDDKTKAITYYNKVIDANPFHADAYSERGQLRIENGDDAGKDDIAYAAELHRQQAIQGESGEDIEKNVRDTYKNTDPYGVFG
ncbi:MAG: tetratricopeptide repeat protein [Prevotella sp.]